MTSLLLQQFVQKLANTSGHKYEFSTQYKECSDIFTNVKIQNTEIHQLT